MLRDYTVLDLEMTGLNAKHHKILEAAAVRVRDRKIVDSFSMLIHQELPLEEEIVRLTGITDEMLKDAPGEEEVLTEFFAFLGEDVLVGHNVIFDYGFLKQAAVNRKLSFERKGVDTLKIARRCLPSEQKKDLETLLEKKINTIAYPYGGYNANTIKITKEYYDYAVTVESGFNYSNKLDRLRLKRFKIPRSMDINTFINVIEGK